MNKSSIQWTDATWNPTRGCSLVSAGCTNCYAMRQAHRFSGHGQAYERLTRMTSNGPVWTGEVRLAEDKLEEPLHWKRPRRIFVNSMSDLFHESLPDQAIDKVFAVMALCPRHTFQLLTKRPERMYSYLHDLPIRMNRHHSLVEDWHHVWLGVSVEDQKTADERIPWLLETPAAVRWVSYEPALQGIDISVYFKWDAVKESEGLPDPLAIVLRQLLDVPGIDWVVCGGESGPGARPFDLQWARDVIAQCKAAGIPVFMKQLGTRPVDSSRMSFTYDKLPLLLKDKKGGTMEEWPRDLRVREYPQ